MGCRSNVQCLTTLGLSHFGFFQVDGFWFSHLGSTLLIAQDFYGQSSRDHVHTLSVFKKCMQ